MIEQSLAWYEASTLSERIESLRIHPHTSTEREIDIVRAERLLERWRTQAPFDKEGFFSQRLKMDGISEEGLKYLLGETVESLSSRQPQAPSWIRGLSEAFENES